MDEEIPKEEEVYYYRKAGQIAYETIQEVKKMIKPDVKIIDICHKTEELIMEKGASGFSFPPNVSLNQIAAHYTSPAGDETVIPKEGLVKYDIGAQVEGFISDTAVTVVLSPEWKDVAKAAEDAYNAGMEIIQPGTQPSMIGRRVEETIKGYGLLPLRELSGHQLERYKLHGDKQLPNIAIPYDPAESTIQAGEAYALECFSSTGKGSVHDVKGRKYIYQMIPQRVPLRSPVTKKIASTIHNNYKTFPFAERWLTEKFDFNPARVRFGLRELESKAGVFGHSPLSDIKGSMTAQHENTFIVTEEDGVIVTTQPPFDYEMPESLQDKEKNKEKDE